MRPDIDRWELTRHFANKDRQTSDITALLESMHEPAKPGELSEAHSLARETIYEVAEPLVPWAIERDRTGAHRLTPAGEIARRTYNEATETIQSEDIKWLSWSENRGHLLNELHDTGPISPKELSERDQMPRKRTIRRNFDDFEDRDWIIREDHSEVAKLTIDGEETSREYHELLIKMEQVIDKAPCLRDLGLECSDLPVVALADTEMVEATPGNPLRIERRVGELSNKEFEHFRAFQSHWNSENAEAFHPHVKAGKQFETISRPLGYEEIPKNASDIRIIAEGLKAENQRWLMSPEELPCSLVILDTDYIAIGARDPASSNQIRTGALFSSNDELIDWGLSLYKDYKQEATDPFNFSVGFSIGIDELLTLLREHLQDDDEDPEDG